MHTANDFEEIKTPAISIMVNGEHEPIVHKDQLKVGMRVFVPVSYLIYDECSVFHDYNGFYARNDSGKIFHLAYNHNWYISNMKAHD